MKKSSDFALIQEMLETIAIVKNIHIDAIKKLGDIISDKFLLTGEWSSRIFPAKRLMYEAHKKWYKQTIITDGAYQSSEYDLQWYTSIVASNSGRTKESLSFCEKNRWETIIWLTCTPGSALTEVTKVSHLLRCGKEQAVAATKSVIEQALFYDILFRSLNNQEDIDLHVLSQHIDESLSHDIAPHIIDMIAQSKTIYRAGRNNGVAEELALKTNEITRKKSQFLEWTYLLHGIEEVMTADDCIIVVDPRVSEIEKIQNIYDAIGTKVVFISNHTLQGNAIPTSESEYNEYGQLVLWWNILVSVWLSLWINLDKPERARKIGNEVTMQ